MHRKTKDFLTQSKRIRTNILLFVFFLISCNVNAQLNDYFADVLPGNIPIPFNPELVPNGMLIHSGIFSPDIEEYYITISDKNFQRFDVKVSRKENGKWSQPEDAFFNTVFNEHGTSFTPDGKYIYFSSTRPVYIGGVSNTWHIWRSEKNNNEWTDPIFIDIPNLRKKLVSHPSLTNDGTMYFHSGNTNYSDLNIYYSKQMDGIFQDAVKLPREINFRTQQNTPFISPDESFILFESTPNLYISYYDSNGSWSIAEPLNEKINKNGKGNPYISPDNNYLFYVAGMQPSPDENWSVYWVSTNEIFQTTGVEDKNESLINKFDLFQNYPNPFNPETIISYELPEAVMVTLTVFDIRGREVKTLVANEFKPVGSFSVNWNGRNNEGNLLSSGIYFYRVQFNVQGMQNYSFVRKMVFLK